MALQPAWPDAWAAAVDPGWGYAARTVLVAGLLAWWWRRYDELRPAAPLRAGALAEAAAVGLAVWLMWIWLGPLLRVGDIGDHSIVRDASGAPDPLWLAARLAGSALVVPVIEELFWRSYLMRRIDAHDFAQLPPQSASLTAVLASSAVFALEHRELAAGFLAGLAYAWLYRRRGDLRLAVLAHAVTNAALGGYVAWTGRFDFW